MDYLVIGNGYIGNYLKKKLPSVTLIKNKIYDEEKLTYLLREMYPSHTLINCAGKTGRPNVDWCEDHRDVTFGSNVGLPVMIAEVCDKLGRYWMHIGSGCIYSGYDEEYTEEHKPDFVGSFYSKTKKWSQQILEDYNTVCTLRIRMPIDENMEERCYISKILNYAKEGKGIVDTMNSMTYLEDLVGVIQHLSHGGHTGTWNVVNRGNLSAIEILEMWKIYTDEDIRYKSISEIELGKYCKAGRSNCLLSTRKLEESGYEIPDLSSRVRQVILKYCEEKAGGVNASKKERLMKILADKAGKTPDQIDEEDVIHSELGLTPEQTREVFEEIAEKFDVALSVKQIEEEFIEVGDIVKYLETAGA